MTEIKPRYKKKLRRSFNLINQCFLDTYPSMHFQDIYIEILEFPHRNLLRRRTSSASMVFLC